MTTDFTSLNLRDEIMQAINELGYAEHTPIQAAMIPIMLSGADVIGQAPGLKAAIYGVVLIAFVLFEPMGLYGRWLKMRTFFQLFPFYRKGLFRRQKSYMKSERLK